MEALVARAECVADAREAEGPDRRADERQRRVRHERHLEDAGGDRDERPDDWRQAADENAGVPPALEPLLGAHEVLGRDVQPPAPALEIRTAAAHPDPPADDGADEVAERSGKSDSHVRLRPEADLRAE